MRDIDPNHHRRWELAGWILFVICALLFMAVGVRDRDGLTLAASGVFLVACLFFLVPLLGAGGKAEPSGENDYPSEDTQEDESGSDI